MKDFDIFFAIEGYEIISKIVNSIYRSDKGTVIVECINGELFHIEANAFWTHKRAVETMIWRLKRDIGYLQSDLKEYEGILREECD